MTIKYTGLTLDDLQRISSIMKKIASSNGKTVRIKGVGVFLNHPKLRFRNSVKTIGGSYEHENR